MGGVVSVNEVVNFLLFCFVCVRSVGIELFEEMFWISIINGVWGVDRIEGEIIGWLFRCV